MVMQSTRQQCRELIQRNGVNANNLAIKYTSNQVMQSTSIQGQNDYKKLQCQVQVQTTATQINTGKIPVKQVQQHEQMDEV